MIYIYNKPNKIQTDDLKYWIIYNKNTSTLILEPIHCSGITSSPYTMVVFDTEEECMNYILENNLTSDNIEDSQ